MSLKRDQATRPQGSMSWEVLPARKRSGLQPVSWAPVRFSPRIWESSLLLTYLHRAQRVKW